MKKMPFIFMLLFVWTLLFVPMSYATKENETVIEPPTTVSEFGNGLPVQLADEPQTLGTTLSDWRINELANNTKVWHVTVQASQLTEVGGARLTLPLNSIRLNGIRTFKTNSNNENNNDSNHNLDNNSNNNSNNELLFENQTSAIDSPNPVEIIRINKHEKKSIFSIIEPENGLILTLNPSTTQLDTGEFTTFTTTITYSIIEGP